MKLKGYYFYQLLAWSYLCVLIYLTLTFSPPQGPDIPFADKWEHFLGYGLLMGSFAQLWQTRRSRLQWAPVFILQGGLLELLQGLGGVRHAEWGDFFANATGVILGLGITWGRGGKLLFEIEKRAWRAGTRAS